jgi:glucosamine--fructose-6-phosphate aminotransferase (isomerizing)
MEDRPGDTFSEIYDQAACCERTIGLAGARLEHIRSLLPLERYSDIVITGCGSSYHMASCASFAWTQMLSRPVQAVQASQLMSFSDRYLAAAATPLVIAITRSGATSEVEQAVLTLKNRYGAAALAITGEPGGCVASASDAELVFDECLEKSIVTTRAFTSMLLGLLLLGDDLAGRRFRMDLSAIPRSIQSALETSELVARRMAEDWRISRFVFLGSGAMKGLADECALKMTEMALSATSSFLTLEFRHGPKAALDSSTQVVLFPVESERPYLDRVSEEILETGASLLVVGGRSPRQFDNPALADSTALSPDVRDLGQSRVDMLFGDSIAEALRPVLYVHIGQLMGYWRAIAGRLNPDSPPYLKRTVLLEQ